MVSAEMQRAIVEFVTSFEGCAPELVNAIIAREDQAPGEVLGGADPGVRRDAAAVGVAVALSAMRIPSEIQTVAPGASLRAARDVAAGGGSLATLLQSYRVGHALIQEHMLLHAERIGTPLLAVRIMTERLFAHVDRLMMQASEEFIEELRRRNSDVDLMLYARVKRLLAGEPEPVPYPVDGRHICVVLDARATPDAAPRLIAELKLPTLQVPTPARETWLWFAAGRADGEDDIRSLLETVLTTGSAGVSERRDGLPGMAVAHRQATLACRLGTLRGLRVSAYSEVALEALAFGGADAARDFASAELGLLADDDERTETLRRTVQAYFSSGGSAAAAAASLGVAERTVTYRLRRAEELVGRPLSTRRAEIEAALRLHRVLDRAAV